MRGSSRPCRTAGPRLMVSAGDGAFAETDVGAGGGGGGR